MRVFRMGAPAVALSLGITLSAAAQQPAREKIIWGLGLGLARASMSVGDATEHAAGPVLNGQLGVRLRPAFGLVGEVDLQPFAVENPNRAENFRATYLMLGARFDIRQFYVEGALGAQARSWGGLDPVTSFDVGPAIGAGAGLRLRRGALTLAPELFWRSALIEVEGSVVGGLAGLRLIGGWTPGRAGA